MLATELSGLLRTWSSDGPRDAACTRIRTCVGSVMTGVGTLLSSNSDGRHFRGATRAFIVSGTGGMLTDGEIEWLYE
jgi:hypothetical protein